MPGPVSRRLATGFSLVLTALVVGALGASGQSVIREDPLDPVYRDLDKLRGFGLIDDQPVGRGPYTRSEIQRLLRMARSARSASTPALANALLERLEERYAPASTRLPRLDRISGAAVVSDLEWRRAPDNGQGRVDAWVNPMLQRRGGRVLAEGENLLGEARFAWAPTDRVGLAVTPRVQRSWSDDAAFEVEDVFLQELQAGLRLGNVLVSAGRQHLAWGQGVGGGLALSSNARGLDLIEIGSDRPFRLPGFLRHLGSISASVFFSRLEEDRDVPNAWLVGYRALVRPSRRFEVGFSVMTQSAGEGAPESSFGERLVDHLVFLEPFFDSGGSNRLASLDGRVLLSVDRGSEVYFEYLVEDPARDLTGVRRWLWQDVGWVVGLWFPRVSDSGSVDLRLEARHAGLILYRHGTYRSGYTVDEQVLGDPVGPDGNAAMAVLGIEASPTVRVEVEVSVERRSADTYRSVEPPGGGQNTRERIEAFPKEDRARARTRLSLRPVGGPFALLLEGGFEWTDDFAFVDGESRSGFALGVTGVWRP